MQWCVWQSFLLEKVTSSWGWEQGVFQWGKRPSQIHTVIKERMRTEFSQLVPENCCFAHLAIGTWLTGEVSTVEIWVQQGAYRKECFLSSRISKPGLFLQVVRHLGCICILLHSFVIKLPMVLPWLWSRRAPDFFFQEKPQELRLSQEKQRPRLLLWEHLVSPGQHPKFQASDCWFSLPLLAAWRIIDASWKLLENILILENWFYMY